MGAGLDRAGPVAVAGSALAGGRVDVAAGWQPGLGRRRRLRAAGRERSPATCAVPGADASATVPGLFLLALTAGPGYGAAGAAVHRGQRGRLIAGVVLGAALVAEGLVLQLGERSPVERAVFAVESAVGVVLAEMMAGPRGALLAAAAGVALLGIELALLATIGPGLP